jgi:hypothetical protein
LQSDEKTALTAIIGSNLPDLRAVFLRGVDDGRGWDDDAGTRINGAIDGAAGVGSYEFCKIEDHTLSGTTSTNGSHNHGGQTGDAGWSRSTDDGGTTGTAAENSGTHNHSISWDGDHSHTFSVSYDAGGGNETRPENISVYYLMRCR